MEGKNLGQTDYNRSGWKMRLKQAGIVSGILAVVAFVGIVAVIAIVIPATKAAEKAYDDFYNAHFCDRKVAVGDQVFNGHEVITADGRRIVVVERGEDLTEQYESTEQGILYTSSINGRERSAVLREGGQMPRIVEPCT